MANPNHLDLLQQGVQYWNEWRAGNPEIKADLRGADLHKAELSQANLSSANLAGAYLRGACLNKAKLNKADLSGADLSGVDLSGIDLTGVDLSGANLSDSTNLTWNQLAAAESFKGARLPPDLASRQASERKSEGAGQT